MAKTDQKACLNPPSPSSKPRGGSGVGVSVDVGAGGVFVEAGQQSQDTPGGGAVPSPEQRNPEPQPDYILTLAYIILYLQDGDAITNAETPVMDAFAQSKTGYCELEASSLAVGLPEGLMGNSEVGHLNIGAGRVVWQDVVRIDQTIKEGKLPENDVIKKTFEGAKNGNGRLHLCGLVSHGGVHSKQIHLYNLLKAAKQFGVPKVFIHFFGDGRDVDPKSGADYMEELVKTAGEIGIGEIATVVGRYYAMDRDKRWERVQIALDGMINGKGEESTDPVKTVRERYARGGDKDKDEFLSPIIVGGDEGRIKDDDTVFFFNYRSDRVRQITQLLGDVDRSVLPDFNYPKIKNLVTMTQYKVDYPFEIAFKPQHMGNVLAEWLGKQGVEQVHIAETEKYAHVTFFFNGGVEKVFALETRDEKQDLVPSNKSVATYDKAPEMSADGVADQVAKRLAEQKFPFVMNNFAPPDMVGHTGVYEAAIVGVEATDKAIGKIYNACKEQGYVLFITADHGNAEEMKFPDGKPKTSHTTNKVPFIMANAPEGWSLKKDGGVLGDVAPTVLAAMGLPQPEEMTGNNLLTKA
ncbi:2,3-bisphosphoglycerate-independent phosphoglycerate mutase [Colletotrichum higginsianum IMI 349063]|uniref:2,3-bisphosphoglycerate-independent phosphoglycerate mutase n=1 Tax=Colletotrichum higginsianum (strain IMI 349063) TaxID=759273 RepID=A0A1B7YVW2_COLHI|nr:2,3-bisphosphoglycerate-independent phosphoglycerate mutase [Colletotrichum higginsianum IMI 349063]OBR16179.1 2,3-bisphosphoglycerate-independent phosphoglycerate mutase [Colletotrichum higginsianum IMI 349063]